MGVIYIYIIFMALLLLEWCKVALRETTIRLLRVFTSRLPGITIQSLNDWRSVSEHIYKRCLWPKVHIRKTRKSTSLNLLNLLINTWDVRSAGETPLNYLEAVNLFHKSNTEKNVANIRRLFTNLHEVNTFGINIFPIRSIFILS